MDSEVNIAEPYIDGVVTRLGKRVSEVDGAKPVNEGSFEGRCDVLTALLGVGERLGVVGEVKIEERKDGEEDEDERCNDENDDDENDDDDGVD